MSPHPQNDRGPARRYDSDSDSDDLAAATSPAMTAEMLRPFFPGQSRSLAGIALRAFCLGAALAAGLVATALIVAWTDHPVWRAPFFLAALALFHFLEFWTTARRNTPNAKVSSFLLTANWPLYAVAHAAATLECLVVSLAFPGRAWAPSRGVSTALVVAGLVMTAGGQAVRSLAMLQAGASFNHLVQTRKADSHVLVTSGLYAVLRHPSYFGFFYWGLGTQLVLGNVFCFVAYALVLWKFFHDRIINEEANLVVFFGNDYVEYRRRVGTLIPFIP